MENKNLTENVEQLIKEELESARSKFNNLNSSHEGYAVILEEFEELKEEIEAFEQNIEALWKAVKENAIDHQDESIRLMEAVAKKIVKEGIQLGAMCRRYSEDILNK